MRSMSLVILIGAAPFLFIGCGRFGVDQNTSAKSSLNSNLPGVIDQSCTINMAQVEVDGNVNAFEFTGGGGVSVGYNPTGTNSNWGANANVHIDRFSMDVSLNGMDPLDSATYVAATEVGSSQTQTHINASVDWSKIITIGTQFYFQTPLATVSRNALLKGVRALKEQMDKIPWIGRILARTSDNKLILNAGTLAGVEAGDTFEIYNVQHDWADPTMPCFSKHYGSHRVPYYALATAKVLFSADADTMVSYLTILGDELAKIQPGAEVIIKNSGRSLKKKANMGHIGARNVTLPGNVQLDLSSVMDNQAASVIFEGGFVLDNR